MDALTNEHYRPDFFAKVISFARLLKISRNDYLEALNKNKKPNQQNQVSISQSLSQI